jgi:hypothetical protein
MDMESILLGGLPKLGGAGMGKKPPMAGKGSPFKKKGK